MKVLVLGPNGQLGSDLFRAQGKQTDGIQLIPLDRSKLDVAQVDKIIPTLDEIDFEALINCTSYHKTDEVEKNGTQAFTINAHAVQKMAQACKEKEARFIHISTDYVFSGEDDRPYTEEDAIGPVNVYGASKAMGERLAQLTHPNTLVLRVASLFGIAGASGKGGNFVETMIKIGKEKGLLKVVDDITMSPTSTFDLAKMILALLQSPAKPGVFHGVNSGQATWFEFAKEIITRAKVNADVVPVPSTEFPTVAQRPRFSVLDNRKLKTLIGEVNPWNEALDQYLIDKGYHQ